MNALARLRALASRFDRAAVPQLRGEVERLARENESLREQLRTAEDLADFWRDSAIDLQADLVAATHGHAAITRDGRMGVVDGTAVQP